MNKQKDRHLFKQNNKQKSVFNGGFLFAVLILVATSVFGMAVLKTEAASGINRQVNYQGRLMDGSGINVGDGNYQMRFSLYTEASGGSPIWSASTTNGLPTGAPADVSVNIKNGLFTVLLGDTSAGQVPLDIDWNQDTLYLGVKVGADSEMSPRKRLTAVPYALNAEMLQGQHASSSIANTGGNLFALNQSANDSATALRTALFVETRGTSNVYDYLLRMSNGSSDVFTINRQGHVTTTGSFALGGNLSIQGIRLDSVGSNPITSGAYLVGVYDEFTFSNATTVQSALNDLDTVIGNVSSSAMGLTLQDVTDNGNTTTNSLEFYGGTSTGDLMPGAHLTYDLGRKGNRWDEIWVRKTRIGTNSWTLEADTSNTFLISEDTFGNYFAITEDGRVGIGTSTPSFFDLEVDGTIGPAQNNLFDLGSTALAWRNIIAQGTVSSTDAIFGSADIGSLSVTNLTIGSELDLSNLIWLNATGTNSILGNLTVTSTLILPNDSVTDVMVSDILTIGPLGNVSATSINSGVLGNANVILSLDSFGQVTGSLPASQITLASTNTAGSLDLQSYLNMLVANGRAFGGETIQTASGTIQVSAGQGLIALDPTNPVGMVYYTAWATSSGISVPFFEWLNVYVHYDSGIASVVATTTDYGDNWTYYKLAMVYNEGDGYLHIHDERSIETRPINRIIDFLENGVGQIITDGCEISDVGTRNIAVSQCTNWYASYERTVPAFDSSGIDSFDTYYSNGLGGFNHSQGFTQWNNLNYDNNSGVLQALAGDEYGVHWVYIHEHGAISLLYGQDNYTDLANAQAAEAPTNLPGDFLDSEHAFLIGAIIFKQGQDTPEFIRDLRPVLVDRSGQGTGSGIVNHNDLAGIQGGTAGEYYHLKATGFDADASLLFSANNGGTFGLEVNDITNTKLTINNLFAGTASLDIIDGDLLLASTTRITNSGAGYLTNLNLSSNLYVTGTALLTTLTVGNATATNLFATNGNFTNLTAGVFGVTDLTWGNATGTYANIDTITGTIATFDNLIATSATFTNVVVMENTNIENLIFGNATGGNLVTYGQVSSTFIYAQDSILGYATSHNMVIDETLRVGLGEFPIVGDSVAQFGGTVDSYLQVNLQNHSSGTEASSDYVATADIGDDSGYYIDFGINSSNYNNPDFSISGPLDGYLYVDSADLTIGAATSGSVIKFHAGGTEATDEVMRITSDHYVGIGTTTPSHTLDVDGDGRFTGLLTLSSATTSELFWGNATGTSLYVTNLARLPSNTMIGGISVCLLDGTNCPSTASPDLQTVSNTGNTTTNWLEFAGGTSTAALWLQAGLTVDGYGDFQDIEFVNASGTNLILSGLVSSTSLISGDAVLANTTMANATATNLNVETLKVGSGNFPVLGASIAQFGGDFNNYLVVNARNTNTGNFASANFTASADVATPGNNYNTTMGVANSGFNNAFFSIANPLDSYFMGNSNDLIIVAATSSSIIKFAAGGTTAANEVMRITSDHYVGIGTTTPSHTLDVDGDGRFTGLLTLSSATTSKLFWGSATGTDLYLNGSTRLALDTTINGVLPCLADGTNCPSSAASNLQTVTNAGNTTTHAIQFAGGTSTADFRFQQDVVVDGLANLNTALFINATGTNLSVLGYINSNLSPMVSDTYTLGDATHRWQGLTVNYVTSTNVLATGYVSSSAMYINGQAVTTSVPTLDQVTTQGNVTANAIQFGGGTSTGSILPGLTDTYNLGSADYRWNEIYGGSFFVGTSTPWSITEEGNQAFSISNNGSEMARITAEGNLYVGTTVYTGGLGATFSPNGNEILANGDIGAMGSVYAGTSFRAGATSTVYSKSSLYKQDGGDYVFQFADVAASPESITGFELSFPPADWSTGGNSNWFQDSSTSSQGTYSAQSGDINDLELNYIETNYTFSSDGILEFDWKVSSEVGYDFLLFCIDNAINCTDTGGGDYVRIDGETNWATVSVPITAGTHNLRWVYDKDFSVSNGSDAAFPAGPNRINQLMVHNGYLYAANDTGASGSASVAICNPAGGGTATACDNAADWTNVTLPIAYEESNTLVSYLNTMYVFVGNTLDDSDFFYCNASAGGNIDTCDVAADWTRPFDNTAGAYEGSYSANVYNGYLYVGRGLSSADGDLIRCEPQAAGSDVLCNNAGDFTTAINNGAGFTRVSALTNYDGSMYIGNEGTTNNGDIYQFTGSNYKVSDVATGIEATYAFAELNGVLYAGRGNATGNGQVYYYQKAREASYALRMEAGSSTGSMWFSSESLNYQGAGTDYEAQTGAFKFSHGLITEAGAYDLAEMYPTLDAGISAGEVVVLDTDNPGYIKKSDLAYAKNIVGVVSAKPGFLLSGKEKDKDLRAVALVGRVPVKVSLENGDIKVGDPLTSSAQPGYAMKATKPGMIIGHAMEDLSAISSSSTQDLSATITNTGTVMMVVQTGYYFGSQETSLGQLAGFLGETTSTQIIQQAFAGDAYAIEQVAGGVINPQYADGAVLNEASFAQLDVLIVKTAALIAGDLTVGGDTRLMGRVIVSDNTAGVVDVPAGQAWVEIVFKTPFDDVPVVVVTPESDAEEFFTPWLGRFRIAKKTKDGFWIEVDEGSCLNPADCGRTMRFNWMAVGLQTQALSLDEATETSATTSTVIGDNPKPELATEPNNNENQIITEPEILSEPVIEPMIVNEASEEETVPQADNAESQSDGESATEASLESIETPAVIQEPEIITTTEGGEGT